MTLRGWRELYPVVLRTALALVLAPAIWTGIWVVGLWASARTSSSNLAIVSPGIFPALLIVELATLVPVLILLLVLRQLTVLRLMLWSGLATGVVHLIWTHAVLGHPLLHWTALFQTAVAVLFGFLNAGLFALIAGVRKMARRR